MLKKFILIICVMMLVGIDHAGAQVQTNQQAPDFTLTDTNGNQHNLSDYKGKYVILEWVNYECPFVVKFYKSGVMQSLQNELTSEQVVWFSINSSAIDQQGYYTTDEINEIMENSDVNSTAYLLDTSGDVGRLYGAKTTPHMYIIDPEGKLIYQGAIDNKPTFDPNDLPGATNYVKLALAAAMKGEPVDPSSTTPYGCSVKY